MNKPLLGEKLAMLVANGFDEKDLILSQRSLQNLGANIRIISMDHGLVNGWNGHGWGLHFAADKALNSALAADFSMLVVPGGSRSINKLKLTAHTKRFISGFIDAHKPVAFMGDAIDLLSFSGRIADVEISGPAAMKDEMEQAGAKWSDQNYAMHGQIMTGLNDENSIKDYVDAMASFFTNSVETFEKAA